MHGDDEALSNKIQVSVSGYLLETKKVRLIMTDKVREATEGGLVCRELQRWLTEHGILKAEEMGRRERYCLVSTVRKRNKWSRRITPIKNHDPLFYFHIRTYFQLRCLLTYRGSQIPKRQHYATQRSNNSSPSTKGLLLQT